MDPVRTSRTESPQFELKEDPKANHKTLDILLFGATGSTGKHVMKQALDIGHKVTVLVRNPEDLSLKDVEHKNLQVKQGDALDPTTFSNYVAGKDAVISCLGVRATPFENITLYSQSSSEIHEAMKSHGITRLICMSSCGTKDSSSLPFVIRWIVRPILFRNYSEDYCRMEEYIRNTELNYTVVKPMQLVDGPLSGKPFVVTEDVQWLNNASSELSRADAASFILQCLQTDQYDRQIVTVGVPK